MKEVTSDQRVHLILARNEVDTEVQLTDERTVYLHQRIDVSKQAVNQRYDLSALSAGTYQLTIKTKDQVVRKTIVIRTPTVQRFVTLI